jgi:hypothetical protein
VRRESRRLDRETTAAEIAAMKTPPESWSKIEASIDEAMATLTPADRSAILLRFFQNLSLREVGATLGVSEDTAQKRVSRAVEQLRAFFLRRGVAVTAAGLATDLSAHVLLVAPPGLGAAISTAATASIAAFETSHIVAMTTMQKSVALAALVVLSGAGVYQGRLVTRQSDEIATVLAQNERATAALRDLRAAQTAASAKLLNVDREIDARMSALVRAAPSDPALEAQMKEWLDQVDRMKTFLAQRPQWDIPELKVLNEQDWFEAAARNKLDSDEQFRSAISRLRDRAVGETQGKIFPALKAYIAAHDGMLPDRATDLAPYLDASFDPAILARYEMLQSGKASDVPRNQTSLIMAPPPADPEFDAYLSIGLNSYNGNSGAAIYENVREAERRFATANPGTRATAPEQLVPYLRWPVSVDAVRKIFRPQTAATTP